MGRGGGCEETNGARSGAAMLRGGVGAAAGAAGGDERRGGEPGAEQLCELRW